VRIVYGADPAVAAWVADRAPLERPHFEKYATVAILDSQGRLCGAVVYHDYRPNWRTVQLSGASDCWVTAGPQTARDILAFAFEKLGVQKIWTQSGLSNARALKLLRAYGFIKEAVLAHEYGDEHCVRMRLLRRDWERGRGQVRKAA
jgi:RimJ/RimL family protein N-acetyltransferase